MKTGAMKIWKGFELSASALILSAALLTVLSSMVSAAYRIPAGITVRNVSAPTPGKQVPQRIIIPAPVDTEWAFLISLPSTYDPNGTKLWPMVVWYGPNCVFYPNQDGNDIDVFFRVGQENGGPARWLQDSERANYTFMGDRFIVVSPYLSGDIFNSNSGQPQRLQALHKYLKATYKVDPARVYLTGGCAGGGIVYEYCQYDTFGIAAIVPISFNDNWRSTVDLTKACKTKYTWIRHYACSSDPMVPYAAQVAVHTSVDACALNPRRDTLITYPDGGHELWASKGVLKTAPAFDWMLTKVNDHASTAVTPETTDKVRPNPALKEGLETRLSPNDRMEIIDMNGKLLQRLSGNGSTAKQMVPKLNRGMYLVKVISGNQSFARIIVAK